MARFAHCILALAALSTLFGQPLAGSASTRFYFRGAGQAREEDARQALAAELSAHGERIQKFEDGLRRLYASLPKNGHGRLGHQAVRYALHRFFLQRHGWFIRGLEPSQATWKPENNASFVKEWVPSFLQEVVEKIEGQRGSDLHDIAAVAATLEDLVHKEAQERMAVVYEAHGFDRTEALPREEADEVLTTYFMSFLVANNFSTSGFAELKAKKARFKRSYQNYAATEKWFKTLASSRLDDPQGESLSASYDLHAVSEVANSLGEEFHSFNDVECDDLRSTLQNLEGRRPGRVRLSTFYNMSRYSHWRFTEKVDFLRSLGALDESDSSRPSVIIPNYVMSRGNCLNGFHLYAICCRNACEDLMGHIEQKLDAPAARPERIAKLVAELGSPSVQAPRNLSASLLNRLEQVAEHHNGQVPLHGRLFSQWMHHAYPLECPYPHEQGKINPQTPAEWLRETGQASTQASEEEMHAHVQSDTCAIDWQGRPECEGESTELPWSVVEELLISHPAAQPALAGARRMLGLEDGGHLRDGVVCLSAVALVVLLARLAYGGVLSEGLEKQQRQLLSGGNRGLQLAQFGGILSLTFLAYCAGMLDFGFFSVSAAASLLAFVPRSPVARFLAIGGAAAHKAFPEEAKCV